MATKPFESRRGGPRLDPDLERRFRALEDWIREGSDAGAYTSSDEGMAVGGGVQAIISGGGGGGGGGGPTALAGDVTGLVGSNLVERIQHVAIDMPVAGDDQQFAQYDLGSGTIRWANVSAVVLPIRTITANDTATTADGVILVNTAGGAVTLALPAAATMTGRVLTVKKISLDANTVTLDGSGVETVDDLATFPFDTPYTALSVISDGLEYWII